ncbi:hypothetical protein G6F70_007182 [Rhizopus microsporus]|nr:hypothetical protein G6F71_007116 [Rhizopus microsporus]KAG1196752.1 hypothetical protein G6F70_007182 [Rhizopus microsporus]KAG1208588.1 hypothetical protein G6F69_007083 [Rhizopus microsporus]KAG1229938.1 hypothetical protein G6F67_006800 [Rhizopus microsporus]KAG1261801.1 hypothetical protein G6F68_006413 [Rhizopus microsporus]
MNIALLVDIYSNNVTLHNSEASFNSCLIHPFLKATINAINSNNYGCTFLPGKEPLASTSKQLKLSCQQEDGRSCYKADGVFRLLKRCNIEVLLLGAAGVYESTDKTKKPFDHHKGMFGKLSMLKSILDEFRYASVEIFDEVKVLFIHAADHRVKLKEARYAKSVALLTDIVNPWIIKLTQAEDNKGMAEQGPWSSPEHD